MKKPITAIVLGAGHRAMVYADYSLSHPDELKIVGVADPDEYRRNMVCEKFGFPKENCFKDADELASVPKFADAIINGTMDEVHVKTSVPLLKLGYDMLLEKPFCVNKAEMKELLDVVNEHKNKDSFLTVLA
jgi:predicted dehydrogenase